MSSYTEIYPCTEIASESAERSKEDLLGYMCNDSTYAVAVADCVIHTMVDRMRKKKERS